MSATGLHSPALSIRPARAARRGSILVVAMWVLISLAGLVLVLSRWARVELLASGNRVAAVQAAAAARAGEQYVLSQIEQAAGDVSLLAESPAEAVPVGPTGMDPTAYFWIMRPDREDDGQQDFAIDDEGSRININTANREVLSKLPGMTPEIADAIIDWRDPDENPGTAGAESEYYQSLQPPYRCKNGPFESVEELLLVKGVTPELLYGTDVNHNGFLDEEELSAGGTVTRTDDPTAPSPRGLLPFVTIHGIGTAPAAGAGGAGGGQGPPAGGGGQGQGQGQGQQPNPGLVNVNTAPREVLRALPGMEDADAIALVAARDEGVDMTSTAWVSGAIAQQKAAGINGSITARSYSYSADVVGVSGDGRAFHRVRVIVDASKSPPAVVYRRDLSGAGWPMDPGIRPSLRAGGGAGMGTSAPRTVRSSAR